MEQDITNQLSQVQQKIDEFLSVIDSSAILFREGLNLLKLQKNLNDALSLFTLDLPTVQKLTRDMEQSWSEMDVLVGSLTSLTVSIKATQNNN